MTASAVYAWPSAAPGAVNPRGPGGPRQLRLARLPRDRWITSHKDLTGLLLAFRPQDLPDS